MPFVNLPVWTAREIVTAAKLGQYTTAMSGFIAGTADVGWPLKAGGNIDMDNQYTIENMRTFWSIVNAGEYPPATALQDAVDAVTAAGGGVVLIPPDTTITSTGVTVGTSNILFLGYGPSSIIQLLSGTGPLIQSDTSSRTDFAFDQLTLSGAGLAGGTGIKLQGVQRVHFGTVWFKDFLGVNIEFVKRSTDGTACTDVLAGQLYFSGGGSNYIKASDLARFTASKIIMRPTTAATGALYMEPAGTASLIQDISIANALIDTPTGKGISILASSLGPVADQSRISLGNVTVLNPTSTGVEIGAASKILSRVDLSNVKVYGATGATGISVRANDGVISDCQAPGASDGLSIFGSTDLVVTGGDYKDCTGNGINAESSTRCTITGTDVRGSATPIRKVGAVDLEACGNLGDISRTADQQRWTGPSTSVIGTSETFTTAYTIPANTLSKPGDGFRITVASECANVGGETLTIRVRIGGGAGTILGSQVISQNQNGVLVVDVVVNANDVGGASNIRSMFYGVDSATTVKANAGNVTASVNMTADTTINISGQQSAGGGTSILRIWKIEYLGGTFV